MRVETIRSQILDVVRAWNTAYNRDSYCYPDLEEKLETGRRLSELNLETTTPEDVAEVIGNTSWACPKKCHECGERFETVIVIGDGLDEKNRTSQYCLECLKKAVVLLEEDGRK